jgi:uncharacterized protein (DUF2236 family)
VDRERYYAEFRQVGPIWGIPPQDFPGSLVDLRAWMRQLIEDGEVQVTPQGRRVGGYILAPPVWWLPAPAAVVFRLATVWLLPPRLREGFGMSWGPGRERLMRALAVSSRAVVPRLPRMVRDLPIARAAEGRVRQARSGYDAGH